VGRVDEDVGEDVRVRVGVVECQLYTVTAGSLALAVDTTMESELARLSTYSSLPPLTVSGRRLNPSRLSRVGFHYDAVAGRVVCHRCRFGVHLQSLVDDGDLDRRHRRQSPGCRQASPPPETRDLLAESRGQLTDDDAAVGAGPHVPGSSEDGEN